MCIRDSDINVNVEQPLKECSILFVEQIYKDILKKNHHFKYITKSVMLHTQSSDV